MIDWEKEWDRQCPWCGKFGLEGLRTDWKCPKCGTHGSVTETRPIDRKEVG